MWLIDRLRALSPPLLGCPKDPGEYLLWRLDTGENGFPLGASLTVCRDEHAMLICDRRIVNQLEPGIYRLDRQQLTELEAIFSWPEDFAGPVRADVLFVSTRPGRRLLWQCRVPGKMPDEPFEAAGTLDFSVVEAKRFAAWHIERGLFDDDAVRRAIEKDVSTALRAHLASRAAGADGTDGDGRETARQLRKRLRADMASRGIGEYALRVRRLQRPASKPAKTRLETATERSNITHLSFERPGARPAAPPTPGARTSSAEPDEIAMILELEREIARLDAWSDIGGGMTPQGQASSPGPTDRGAAAGQGLPDHFHGLSFYIAVNLEQTGPFDVAEFEQALREGAVGADTLVWFQGLDDWRAAGEIAEIAALLPARR